MTFLFPIFFWTLLGLMPLVAVYFLKLRPRRKPTTAYFLWQALFDQKRSSSLFQKLRDLLSLLLMLLAFLAVVFALCAPEFAGDERKDLLLLVDNSASMNARDQGQTRLALAKGVATQIVRSLGANQQAAIAAVAWDVQFHSHFTTNPRTLMEALDRVEASACPLQERALTALSLEQGGTDRYRIILISDGAGLGEAVPGRIELLKVGTRQDNVGLVACDIQALQTQPYRLSLYFRLASSYQAPIETDILVKYGPQGQTVKVIPVTIQPGINKPELYTIEAGGEGQWWVEIDLEDALAEDNLAYLVVAPKRPVTVEVQARDAFFLEHSVFAFAQTSGDLALVDGNADVVLAKGEMPDAARVVLFAPQGSSPWWTELGEELDDVMPQYVIDDHPILKHCDFESLPFVGARRLERPAESVLLLETSDGVPLIYKLRRGDRSVVVVNMDPGESEFYYSAWFPVLVYNAARDLMGRQGDMPAAYAVGSVIPIPKAKEEEPTRISHHADEKAIEITAASFGPVRKLGFYEMSNSSGRWPLAVDLFARAETLLNNDAVSDTSRPLNRGWPFSVILAVLALLILLAECMLYHRRKVG